MMDPLSKVGMWWLLFGGTHVLGSSVPVRTRLIRALGLQGFKGLYSLVSFATFIPLVWVYASNKHAGTVLYASAPWMNTVTDVLMFLALFVLTQGFVTPNPLSTQAEMSGQYTSSARGIQRVTRHPLNTAAALMGLGHMISNPFSVDWLFWGGLVAYSIISAAHQDRRLAATGPDAVRHFQAETSAIPLAAVLAGRQRLRLGELSKGAALVAVVLFAVLRAFHGAWFGGFGS